MTFDCFQQPSNSQADPRGNGLPSWKPGVPEGGRLEFCRHGKEL